MTLLPAGATHWGQQCFFVNPVIEVTAGDSIRCVLSRKQRPLYVSSCTANREANCPPALLLMPVT